MKLYLQNERRLLHISSHFIMRRVLCFNPWILGEGFLLKCFLFKLFLLLYFMQLLFVIEKIEEACGAAAYIRESMEGGGSTFIFMGTYH